MHKTLMTGLSAAALVLATSAPSFAGGFAETDIEPEVFVVEEAAGSLGGLGGTGVLIGVVAIAALAALASSDDTEEEVRVLR